MLNTQKKTLERQIAQLLEVNAPEGWQKCYVRYVCEASASYLQYVWTPNNILNELTDNAAHESLKALFAELRTVMAKKRFITRKVTTWVELTVVYDKKWRFFYLYKPQSWFAKRFYEWLEDAEPDDGEDDWEKARQAYEAYVASRNEYIENQRKRLAGYLSAFPHNVNVAMKLLPPDYRFTLIRDEQKHLYVGVEKRPWESSYDVTTVDTLVHSPDSVFVFLGNGFTRFRRALALSHYAKSFKHMTVGCVDDAYGLAKSEYSIETTLQRLSQGSYDALETLHLGLFDWISSTVLLELGDVVPMLTVCPNLKKLEIEGDFFLTEPITLLQLEELTIELTDEYSYDFPACPEEVAFHNRETIENLLKSHFPSLKKIDFYVNYATSFSFYVCHEFVDGACYAAITQSTCDELNKEIDLWIQEQLAHF